MQIFFSFIWRAADANNSKVRINLVKGHKKTPLIRRGKAEEMWGRISEGKLVADVVNELDKNVGGVELGHGADAETATELAVGRGVKAFVESGQDAAGVHGADDLKDFVAVIVP